MLLPSPIRFSLGLSIALLAPLTARASEAPIIAFAPSPELAEWARAAAGDGSPEQRMQALHDAVSVWLSTGALRADPDNTPKARAPKTAAMSFALATNESAAPEARWAGCYELSALLVAAARAAGVPAFGAERVATEGVGQVGHVVAVVNVGDALRVFDLQNRKQWRQIRGRTEPAGSPQVETLSDAVFAGHHYNHLGVAALLGDRLEEAWRAMDTAVAWAPAHPAFLNNRAHVLARAGQLGGAVAEARAATLLAPHVPVYHYHLGQLLWSDGRRDEALAELERAVALAPSYGLAQRDLGWWRAVLGDATRAQASLEQAAALRETPRGRVYLALFLWHRGDEAKARSVLGTAPSQDLWTQALKEWMAGRKPSPRLAETRRELETLRAALP